MSLHGTYVNVKSSTSFQIQKKISLHEIQKSHKMNGQRKQQIERKTSKTNLGKQAALRFKRNLNLMPLIIEKFFQPEECYSTKWTVIPPIHANFKFSRLQHKNMSNCYKTKTAYSCYYSGTFKNPYLNRASKKGIKKNSLKWRGVKEITQISLLYIDLTISFLIGWKHTVNFRNWHPWHHLAVDIQ